MTGLDFGSIPPFFCILNQDLVLATFYSILAVHSIIPHVNINLQAILSVAGRKEQQWLGLAIFEVEVCLWILFKVLFYLVSRGKGVDSLGNLKDKFSLGFSIDTIDTIKGITVFVDHTLFFEIFRGNSQSSRIEIANRIGFVNTSLVVLIIFLFRIFEFLVWSNNLSIKGKRVIHLSLHFSVDRLIRVNGILEMFDLICPDMRMMCQSFFQYQRLTGVGNCNGNVLLKNLVLLIFDDLDDQKAVVVTLLAVGINIVSRDEKEVSVHYGLPLLSNAYLRMSNPLKLRVVDIHQYLHFSLLRKCIIDA